MRAKSDLYFKQQLIKLFRTDNVKTVVFIYIFKTCGKWVQKRVKPTNPIIENPATQSLRGAPYLAVIRTIHKLVNYIARSQHKLEVFTHIAKHFSSVESHHISHMVISMMYTSYSLIMTDKQISFSYSLQNLLIPVMSYRFID